MTPPIRFALGTGAGWVGLRTAALLLPLPWTAVGPALLPSSPAGSLITTAATAAIVPHPMSGMAVQPALDGPEIGPVALASLALLNNAAGRGPDGIVRIASDEAASDGSDPHANLGARGPDQPATGDAAVSASAAAAPPTLGPTPAAAHASSLSGSAWLFLRGGPGLASSAPGGELGGSQAGARINWRPRADVPVALTARVSGPTGGELGAEAALGLSWQPVRAVPVTVTAERRAPLDRGGRHAWAAFAAGGLYDKRVIGLRVDGYGEAGVVGARRRDLFADGAVRVGKPVQLAHGASLSAGAGVWGAAQPHLARLDAGPQLSGRIPAGRTGLSAALDWRMRVSGNARPRSGPSLTVGVDF